MSLRLSLLLLLLLLTFSLSLSVPAWADVADPEPDKKDEKKDDDKGCSQVPGGAMALPSLLAGVGLALSVRRRRG